MVSASPDISASTDGGMMKHHHYGTPRNRRSSAPLLADCRANPVLGADIGVSFG